MMDPIDGSARGEQLGRAGHSLRAWAAVCHGLLVVVLGAYWGTYLAHQQSVFDFACRRDFVGVYVGARTLTLGAGARLYDLGTQRATMDAAISPLRHRVLFAFVYPGYVAVVLRPLGLLSLAPAFLLWTSINLAATAWMAVRLLRHASGRVPARLAVLTAMLASLPLQLTLLNGQVSLLPAIAVMEAWFAIERGKGSRAGFWLALGLVKPHLLLFPLLALILWRQWRALAAFFAVALALLLVSVLDVGFWVPAYLRFLAAYNRGGAEVARHPAAMQNWRSLFISLGARDAVLWPLSLGLVSAVVAVWLCLRFCPGLGDSAARIVWAIVVVLGLASAPHLYLHDWVVALPAGVFLWRSLEDRMEKVRQAQGVAALWLHALLGAGPPAFFAAQFFGRSGPLPLVPVYVIAVVVATVACLRRMGTVA
jgi:hypothetical protein